MNSKEALEKVKKSFLDFDNTSWKEFLVFSAKFTSYSYNNRFLVYYQMPEATYLKGYRAWQKEGRQVKKGEHGIRIFAPLPKKVVENGEEKKVISGFRLVSVFDISQTEGNDDELPTLVTGLRGDVPDEYLENIKQNAPIPITITEKMAAHGMYDFKDHYIVVKQASKKQMFKTMLHELGHYYHEQVGWEEEDDRQKEFIAESVACAVAAMNNIDTTDYSVTYIKAWLDDYKQFDKLQKKIEKIIKKINKLCDFQKAEVA